MTGEIERFEKAVFELNDLQESHLTVQQNQCVWDSGKDIYIGPTYWEEFFEWRE